MEYLIFFIIWYLIGVFGGGYVAYKIEPKITIKDVIFLLTIGGIGGMFTILIGLPYLIDTSEFLNRKIF